MINDDITILVFTYNEEKRIRHFLEITKEIYPVIVIDNFSTDGTVNIAKEYTEHVYRYKNPGYTEHPDCIEFALSHVPTQWVFWGRADEIPPITLLKKLDEVVRIDTCDVVLISRLNLLFGVPTRTWGDDYQIAFFKKEYLNYRNNALFENTIMDGARVKKLPATRELSLWHFSNYDISAYLHTNNRYSTIAANSILEQRNHSSKNKHSHHNEIKKRTLKRLVGWFQSSRRFTLLRVILNPYFRFIWHYLIRGGVRSGSVGLIASYLMMIEQILTELKIWELENGISREKIDSYYDYIKDCLIKGNIPDLEERPFMIANQTRY